MFSRIESTRRSNHSIFLPQNYGSPFNDMAEHISGLGLSLIDFERRQVAGKVIYSVEGDSTPTSQQDEEARIATIANALKKIGDPEDAAEFMRCLNAICEGGDARYRQVAASEKKLGYLGWAMYGDNNPSHPIHKLNSCEQTRVWEVWNGCKELLPLSQLNHLQLSAKLCATWGRALPVACFIFQAVAKELFELPRLRKTMAIVLNRQSATTRKPSSASKSAVPTLGASAMKRGAAVKSCAEAASSGRQ